MPSDFSLPTRVAETAHLTTRKGNVTSGGYRPLTAGKKFEGGKEKPDRIAEQERIMCLNFFQWRSVSVLRRDCGISGVSLQDHLRSQAQKASRSQPRRHIGPRY
jgi:hypothetical protein